MAEDITKESNYSASNIQVLEGLEAVRKRPAMYIGDISEKGLHHLVNETVDNSIDEAMAGFCTHIEVTINEDESITVQDNGRGIPVDEHEKLHKSALEVVMTVLHAGGKFDKGSYKVSGGLHGVGVSCVNALSSHMLSQVFRDGKIYQQEYEKGKPLYPVKVVGETELRGTRQQFWPDPTVFTTTTYKYDIIAKRMRELAYLNAGITITLTDMRPDEEGKIRKEVFHAKDGLKEFVRYVDRHRTHLFDDVIYLKTEKQNIPIEVAVMYNTDYSENIHSYVNNINTIEGGTHLVGFRMALTRTLKKYADADPVISKQIEKAKIEIAGEDFREGLTAVISIKVAEPQFEGQTKTKLGNSEVTGAVQQAVGEALTYYLEEHPKEAKQICDKVILAATARIAARKARESVQRKNPMTGGGLPGKLADCANKDPKECEICLVEGDRELDLLDIIKLFILIGKNRPGRNDPLGTCLILFFPSRLLDGKIIYRYQTILQMETAIQSIKSRALYPAIMPADRYVSRRVRKESAKSSFNIRYANDIGLYPNGLGKHSHLQIRC